jgi:hypothetical protein
MHHMSLAHLDQRLWALSLSPPLFFFFAVFDFYSVSVESGRNLMCYMGVNTCVICSRHRACNLIGRIDLIMVCQQ